MLDLRLAPDESDGVELVRARRTRRLISTDIGELNREMTGKPVQVTRNNLPPVRLCTTV